jgi:hypothetical protein
MAIQINGDSGISGVNGSAGTPALQGTDSNTGIVFGTDTVQISTGGSTRVTVDSSGSATFGGVGTFSGDLRVQDGGNFRVRTAADASSDAILLQNNGNITASGSATFAGQMFINCPNATALRIRQSANGDNKIVLKNTGEAEFSNRVNAGSNTLDELAVKAFNNSSSSPSLFCQNFNSSGDVFLASNASNTTVARIGVNGSATFNGDVKFQSGKIYVQNSASGTGDTDGLALISDGNADKYLWNYDNTSLRFGTNNAERTRIDAGGTVFTRHPTSTSLIVATGGAASGSNPVFAVRRSSTAITTGTNVFFVYSNGSYATISDQSKKKNIESTRDGYLDDLNRLRVVKYNWNEQEDTDPKELGLIAQEVEEVFPGLISQMNEDGEETTKGIKYSVLPVMLLKALQEAIAKIETLEQRLSDAGIA